MNRKQLILLIVVGAVVGGLGLYSYNARKSSWEDSSQKLGKKVISAKLFIDKSPLKFFENDFGLSPPVDVTGSAGSDLLRRRLEPVYDKPVSRPVALFPSTPCHGRSNL